MQQTVCLSASWASFKSEIIWASAVNVRIMFKMSHWSNMSIGAERKHMTGVDSTFLLTVFRSRNGDPSETAFWMGSFSATYAGAGLQSEIEPGSWRIFAVIDFGRGRFSSDLLKQSEDTRSESHTTIVYIFLCLILWRSSFLILYQTTVKVILLMTEYLLWAINTFLLYKFEFKWK